MFNERTLTTEARVDTLRGVSHSERHMQPHRECLVFAAVILVASMSSLRAQGAPQEIRVETLYPHHAVAGRTTVINVAVPSPDAVQSAEVSPSAGIRVAAITGSGSGSEQNIGWWEIALDVAGDAAPGDRKLVLVMRAARTAPVTIAIPTHAPAISDLHVAAVTSGQPTYEVQLSATDPASDLGASPYVWFTADCGGEPIVGAVRSRAAAGIVRAQMPDFRTAAGGGATADRCDLRLRVTDLLGIDSNTVKTTVELGK